MRGRLAIAAAVTLAVLGIAAIPAHGAPKRSRAALSTKMAKPRPTAVGAARVAIGVAGVLRQVDPRGRRVESLSLEEDTARRIEELLRGPLRVGTTAIYVADARTGQPVFAVHPDDPLNPASNVKLLSTAAAIEILGPDFRYQTRIIGSVPHHNVVRGDVYLLGSYDPTLGVAAMDQLAADLAAAGVTRIEGDVVVGESPTRDAVYRSLVPVEISAGASAGAAATVTLPVGYDYVIPTITATTVSGRKMRRARVTFAEKSLLDAHGNARIELTVAGTIAAGRTFTHWFWARDRGRHAAHMLRAALAAQGVAISGDVHKAELARYLFDRIRSGDLPLVLARHSSDSLADIVARVNKRSINWLADRVIMTAAALKYDELPSMERAVDAMYEWLRKRLNVGKSEITIDTGSGLSRSTQFSTRYIAEVLRVAGGFSSHQEDDPQHRLWLDSLAFADGSGQDGTLRGRFRSGGFVGRLRGKTGTLSTSIALSGVLDADLGRPLVFSIVTNGASALPKNRVRAGHDRIVALLSQYLSKRNGATAPTSSPRTGASTPRKPAVPVPAASRQEAPDDLGVDGTTAEAAEGVFDGEGNTGAQPR